MLTKSPSQYNLFFAFNQCFGYKNDYIVNDEQIANINMVINKVLFKLNRDLLSKIGF